jgi:hypothetical protein
MKYVSAGLSSLIMLSVASAVAVPLNIAPPGQNPAAVSAVPKIRDEVPVNFDSSILLQNPEDWRRKNFDVVVVVNTSACGQTAQIFKFKKERVGTDEDLIPYVTQDPKTKKTTSSPFKTVKVSTGIAMWSMDDSYIPGAVNNPFFAVTHSGYYIPTVDSLDIDHHSSELEDAFMQYGVGYNGADGQYTHRTGYAESGLGKRASHGCVRMSLADSRDLFGPCAPRAARS